MKTYKIKVLETIDVTAIYTIEVEDDEDEKEAREWFELGEYDPENREEIRQHGVYTVKIQEVTLE